MKKIEAVIDGEILSVNIVETASEYTEGARASGKDLKENEGYLFDYDTPQVLSFENTGVPFDLEVLYFTGVNKDLRVVMAVASLQKDSSKLATCYAPHGSALELRKDFCDKHGIGIGSVLSLYEDED